MEETIENKLENFDTEKTEPLHGKKMVVVVLPHKPAYEAIVGTRLEDLQRAVQGLIEITYPFDDNAVVIGNDEAKLIEDIERRKMIIGITDKAKK